MENNQTPTNNVPVFQSFQEFWPFYLSQHSNRTCRKLHIVGTTLGLLIFLNGLRTGHPRAILPALFVGYGLSWIGHFFYEKNRPATFTYPRWSLLGDFRMLWLFYTGKLPAELARHNIT